MHGTTNASGQPASLAELDGAFHPAESSARVELLVRTIGEELLKAARAERTMPWTSKFWSDQLMAWAMRDPDFEVQLFRFVDAFPMLRTPQQVHEYLVEYMSQPGLTLPGWTQWGLKAGGIAKGLFAAGVTNRIASLASHFIAGTDADSVLPKLERSVERGHGASASMCWARLAWATKLARDYQRRYLELVEILPRQAARWQANPTLETRPPGRSPADQRVDQGLRPLRPRRATRFPGLARRLQQALQPDPRSRGQHDVLVNFDMEQHALKDLTFELFERCCEAVRLPRRHRPAGLPPKRRGRRAATHRLGPAKRAAGHRPADQGRLLGLRSHPRRA